MELRPLKCCICPKLTPRAQNFEHGMYDFFHLVTDTTRKSYAEMTRNLSGSPVVPCNELAPLNYPGSWKCQQKISFFFII